MKNIWKIAIFLPLLSLISCGDKTNSTKKDTEEKLVIDNRLTDNEIKGGILTPEILWKFNRIGSYTLSPNGETVAFTITKYSLEANKGQTHIYTVPMQGGEITQITQGNASCYNPQWIDNGERIAYLTSDDSGTQVWSMTAEGKDNKKLTEIEGGINHFDISPNGEKILWCADVKLIILTTFIPIYPKLTYTWRKN